MYIKVYTSSINSSSRLFWILTATKAGCEVFMNIFSMIWPENLDCDALPDVNDTSICIGYAEAHEPRKIGGKYSIWYLNIYIHIYIKASHFVVLKHKRVFSEENKPPMLDHIVFNINMGKNILFLYDIYELEIIFIIQNEYQQE